MILATGGGNLPSPVMERLCDMNVLKRISDALDNVVSTLSGAFMTVLTVLTLIGVFFRYVLGSPIAWVYEFTIVCFSWMIFLGAAMAFKNNEHISLTIVVGNLPPKLQYWWRQVIFAICIVFLAVGIFHGFKVVGGTWGQTYNTIPVPKGVFYLSFPLAGIPAIIHLIVQMFELKVGDHIEHDERLMDEVIHEHQE